RCSRLAVPLAQEIPACRPLVAGRVIRSCALSAALLGAEPIPLLDLPLQVAVNWRMALQLAAIYGRGPLDYRSREMIGTVVWNLGLRRLIQQVCKLVPVLGWAASAGLSGSATWLLGNGLRRYFEDEERWHEAPAALKTAMADRRRRVVEHIREWWGRAVQPARLMPIAQLQKRIYAGRFPRLRVHLPARARRSHPDNGTQQHTVSGGLHPDETVRRLDQREHRGLADS
ncbi:MAG: DUF697 domain-containing protein, partial [Anaerolineae bacterium]